MTRLLRADHARLRKTRSFWICFALAAADGLFGFIQAYLTNKECAERMGSLLLGGGAEAMLFSAIFTALFLGTDYSNGTIRNKLIIGHTRAEIYFSNLLTVLTGTFSCAAAQWTVKGVCGLITGGKLGMTAEEFMLCLAAYVCALGSLCAVNTLIGTLTASKSSTVAVTLVSVFGTFVISATLLSLLRLPKYAEEWVINEDGTVRKAVSDTVSPTYVDGAWRVMMTTLNNVLPCGPLLELEGNGALPENDEALPLYSLGVLAVSTGIGGLAFRKKDLK